MQPSDSNALAQQNIYNQCSELLSILNKNNTERMLLQFVCWKKAMEACADDHPLHTSGKFCIWFTLEWKFFYASIRKKA